jgi:hypothetical protein
MGDLAESDASAGFRVTLHRVKLGQVPVDFFADPDGIWDFESLAAIAGFEPDAGVAIGALTKDFCGHPAGAAVVTLNTKKRAYVAIVECPVAFAVPEDEAIGEDSGERRIVAA